LSGRGKEKYSRRRDTSGGICPGDCPDPDYKTVLYANERGRLHPSSGRRDPDPVNQVPADDEIPPADLWRRDVRRGHGTRVTQRTSPATRSRWWWWRSKTSRTAGWRRHQILVTSSCRVTWPTRGRSPSFSATVCHARTIRNKIYLQQRLFRMTLITYSPSHGSKEDKINKNSQMHTNKQTVIWAYGQPQEFHQRIRERPRRGSPQRGTL